MCALNSPLRSAALAGSGAHRPIPYEPGMGWEFVPVGQRVRLYDQFFSRDSEWVETSRFGKLVEAGFARLYRRRVKK